ARVGCGLRGSLRTALDGPDHSCRTSTNEGVAIQCASRSEWNLQAVVRNSSPPSSQIGPHSAAYQIAFSIVPRAARIEPATTSLSPYTPTSVPPSPHLNTTTVPP